MASQPTYHQRRIAEVTGPDTDPRHVEAWMRVEHRTLDGLSGIAFDKAVHTALGDVSEAGPDASEALAASFGL